jgi:DNA-nicking Smr family endonuclease
MSKNNKNSTNPENPEDIKAWEDFKNQKFLDGDNGEISKKSIKRKKKQDHIDFKIDLHGYSLQDSFQKIKGIIENCYQKDLKNILIITGKGLRSKVKDNPYLSDDLSLLKYAVPNFIKDNFSDIINSIEEADQSLGGSGAFLLRLKKRL